MEALCPWIEAWGSLSESRGRRTIGELDTRT